MSFIENILKSVVLDQATIIEKNTLSDSAVKIRIQGDSIKKIAFVPGYFLRLGIGIENEQLPLNDKVRSYSIWDIDTTNGTIDIAIATLSGGVGSQWAKHCKVGDNVYYKLKKGKFLVDDSADSYLLLGDLSALSHLYMINRHLGLGKQVQSIIYSQQYEQLFTDVDGSKPFDFYEMAPYPRELVIPKLKEIVTGLPGKAIIYIAGDSRLCIAVTQYLRKELNWESKQIKTKPFWSPDKKGLE
ncbi:siderophore-interacting protein [Dyadobacter tibetensis]|uniref:siderophore-interacting protein n=1 Tax=Dyadobacter tibetensis TaxID=1211851 RepID=UPI00046E7A70|nr:FAD-binding oxidoreductase [Dyadobacter tibetensis]